ncbi:hypothetical protein [Paludisphaera rhizosphaerae]|uniref:hypothetical protein n=1 Tax=Paludisphaera rhizosphaerae TaxID=2711216 RepID=UPI0013EE2DA4|nr:hypothetical protein [Paludisphaera rhizosphaerae]
MKRKIDLVLGLAALSTAILLTAVASGDVPLGIPGEWVWPRIIEDLPVGGLLIAGAGVAVYGAFAAAGFRSLGAVEVSRRREAAWLFGLVLGASAVQAVVPIGAPGRYGLERWGVIHCYRVCTGYYDVVKEQVGPDPWAFLADYPRWVRAQGAGHLGVHPPGLIAGYCGLLALTERHPAAADLLNSAMPSSTADGFRQVEVGMGMTIPAADRAAVYLATLITLFACAGTVAPLYLLARESLPPQVAWASAILWPLAPAANLFQPLSDVAYPFLSACALAAAAWAARLRSSSDVSTLGGGRPLASVLGWAFLAVVSGAVMGFGMMFTLALLPVGLSVALVVMTTRGLGLTRGLSVIVAIGAGFLGVVAACWLATRSDPFATWAANLANNARFNEGMRGSYLTWLIYNPFETAIAAGLPAFIWAAIGLTAGRRLVPRAAWCTLAVLAIADLSGRNMGEVARLWILFLPPLFLAAGVGLRRLNAGFQAVFVTVALTGVQTLGLQCMIQLVYPP